MKSMKKILAILFTVAFVLSLSISALAADNGPAADAAQTTEAVADTAATADTTAAEASTADSATGSKAIAAAICVGLAAAAGALAMGNAIAKSSEGISRQPEAAGDIRTSLMLGLVFIETAIIYGLIIGILIIFVL